MFRLMAAAALAMLLMPWAEPARALRCDGGFVENGDSRFEVKRACGEPSYVDRPSSGVVGEMQEWYYNRGPQQFIRILFFRDGDLVNDTTGGYGFNERATSGCSPYAIGRGMSKFELLTRCGEPEHRESRWAVPRRHGYWYRGGGSRIDEWVYNFGPNQFIRHVRIVDGRVRDVEIGDRGY